MGAWSSLSTVADVWVLLLLLLSRDSIFIILCKLYYLFTSCTLYVHNESIFSLAQTHFDHIISICMQQVCILCSQVHLWVRIIVHAELHSCTQCLVSPCEWKWVEVFGTWTRDNGAINFLIIATTEAVFPTTALLWVYAAVICMRITLQNPPFH